MIINNGLRQEGQQWGSEHAPEIDPFIAKRMTVVKGASGVRYGADAIGGVILVEPDELPTQGKISGEINTASFLQRAYRSDFRYITRNYAPNKRRQLAHSRHVQKWR